MTADDEQSSRFLGCGIKSDWICTHIPHMVPVVKADCLDTCTGERWCSIY